MAVRTRKAKIAISPPAPVAAAPAESGGKLGQLVRLLQRPDGATLDDMIAATGWQAHSVRGGY